MRVKIFASNNHITMEEEINEWLKQNEDEVVIISIQSTVGEYLSVTIVYEPSESFLKEVKDANG